MNATPQKLGSPSEEPIPNSDFESEIVSLRARISDKRTSLAFPVSRRVLTLQRDEFLSPHGAELPDYRAMGSFDSQLHTMELDNGNLLYFLRGRHSEVTQGLASLGPLGTDRRGAVSDIFEYDPETNLVHRNFVEHGNPGKILTDSWLESAEKIRAYIEETRRNMGELVRTIQFELPKNLPEGADKIGGNAGVIASVNRRRIELMTSFQQRWSNRKAA